MPAPFYSPQSKKRVSHQSAPYIAGWRCGAYQRAVAGGDGGTGVLGEPWRPLGRGGRGGVPRSRARASGRRRGGASEAGAQRLGSRTLGGKVLPVSHLVRASGEARPSPGGTIGLGRGRDWAGAGQGAGSRPRPTDTGRPATPSLAGHPPAEAAQTFSGAPPPPSLARRAGPGVMRRGTPVLATGRRRRRR